MHGSFRTGGQDGWTRLIQAKRILEGCNGWGWELVSERGDKQMMINGLFYEVGARGIHGTN